MKPQEVRDLSLDQIGDRIRNFSRDAMNLRFEQATGQLKNTAQLRALRRDIARLKTERRQRVGKGG